MTAGLCCLCPPPTPTLPPTPTVAPQYLQLLCARSREAEPVRQHLLGHLAALVEAASGSSAHCKELQRALAATREQMGQLLAGHLAARDFSDASASLWHRLLARLLGLGLAWAPLLACLLAALHGLPSVGTMDKRWLEGVEECVAAVLQDVMQLPPQQRQQRPWQEREQEAVERVGELATALAALAAAVVQHQQGPQLVAQMAELSGFVLLPLIGRFTENTIEWQQQAPLFLAAKPALVGALRAAASAVALHGTSAEVYRKLEMEVMVWTVTTELQLLWGPELLAELLPVLLPPALLQLPMGERRGLEGREEAEQLGKLALKLLKPTLNDKSGGSGSARARVQELLVHCALQNPWLPRLAARAVFLLAVYFPGCLTAAASAGAQPGLLERLVAADVGFAALPSTFPLICRGRTDLLAPLLALQRLPASSLFDCRLLHQLYQQHRRPYCSRWLGSDCGDNLWVVLPPCWWVPCCPALPSAAATGGRHRMQHGRCKRHACVGWVGASSQLQTMVQLRGLQLFDLCWGYQLTHLSPLRSLCPAGAARCSARSSRPSWPPRWWARCARWRPP